MDSSSRTSISASTSRTVSASSVTTLTSVGTDICRDQDEGDGEIKSYPIVSSAYLRAFMAMLDPILEKELHLLSHDEIVLITRWNSLSYEARYLFVRLWLRTRISLPTPSHHGKVQDQSQGTHAEKEERKTTRFRTKDLETRYGRQFGTVLHSGKKEMEILEAIKELREAGEDIVEEVKEESLEIVLGMLSLSELRTLAKDLRISNPGSTTEKIIATLSRFSSTQSTLSFSGSFFSSKKDETGFPTTRCLSLHFDAKGKKRMGSEIVLRKALDFIGPCLRLSLPILDLFSRIHLIYNRSTSLPSPTSPKESMTPSLLQHFHKLSFASYQVSRTSKLIFKTREQLVEYEEALREARRLEEVLGEESGWGDDWRAIKKRKEEDGWKDRKFKDGKKLFDSAYARWKDVIERENANTGSELMDMPITHYYLLRFRPGHPLTRILYHAEQAILAPLKLYELCVEVLYALLAQRYFRRGKRGAWYERLALILMSHFGCSDKRDLDGQMEKKRKREEALEVIKRGLEDEDTHIIYRSALEKRKKRLEKLLRLGEEEREKGDKFTETLELREARERVFRGERIVSEKIKDWKAKKEKAGETEAEALSGLKSCWRMCDGGEGSVEDFALEGYKKKGWKGYHSENGILTTIFGLLFFDIIFEDVEGVFETPFQSAPLDLTTDAFCITRAKSITKRLAEIEAGEGSRILEEVDDREREKKTCCVGVRWDLFLKQDLLEAVQCISPKALVCICRVFAEEWGHRASGMPDLCLWKSDRRKLKFAEVKGPGDRLSESQRVWIDLLIGVGVEVELCKVVQFEDEDEERSARKAKKDRKRDRRVMENGDVRHAVEVIELE